MSSSQTAALPRAAITVLGCVLVTVGHFAEGRTEIVALGVGSLVVASMLGTALTISPVRRS